MSNSIPIIRLELESMKHAICFAFTEHMIKMDSQLQDAVKAFCTPENIQSIIDAQVRTVLKAQIENEIRDFYTYGEGRKAVKEAIQKRLNDNQTSLDD